MTQIKSLSLQLMLVLTIGSVAVLMALFSLSAHGDRRSNDPYAALEGLRFGLSVTDLEGNILEAHRADERFVPASTAKLFVTSAALSRGDDISALDSGLQVRLERDASGLPGLVLVGRGDPTIGFGEECESQCLEDLADAVVRAGVTEVGDITGDDRWFADEPTPLGWNWDDLKFRHGTAVSALSVNGNVVAMGVRPSRSVGQRVIAGWKGEKPGYFQISNEALTSDSDAEWALRLERRTGEKSARIYGALPAESRSITLRMGVDNPAHLVAWSFKQALEARGVTVRGDIKTRHRPLQYSDEPQPIDPGNENSDLRCGVQSESVFTGSVLTSMEAASLESVVNTINRDSNNLYAEVLLRQVGRAAGTGSSFCGRLQIENHLNSIGIDRASFEVADGSGLSNYNRATPAAMTAVLRHAASEPWAETFKASLPVGGGSEGTLRFRFRGTALDGKIFARTGTLNHVNALSGYMHARSGKMLAFSIIVNDRPLNTPSARPLIDQVLLDIAARH